MKVSIIIPIYNAEKYLKESLESALSQTYKDIEIIVVDDGSTDNSLNILNQYSDRIKIIQKKHGGSAAAVNTGIKSMKGEWMKRLDADDILYKDAIEVSINALKRLDVESTSCIIYTNYDVINYSGKKLYEFTEPNFNDLSNFERGVVLLDHHVGHFLTSLIHKSVFGKCGLLNERYKYVEDYDFWLRCLLLHNFKFILIPQVTAKYRIHETQLTQVKRKIMFENTKKVRNNVLNQLDPELKKKYLHSLKEFQKNKYSWKIRTMLRIQDFLLNVLPEPLAMKLLIASKKSEMGNKIYHKAMNSWKETRKN